MGDSKLESIYNLMPQKFCDLLKIYDHMKNYPKFKFSDFLTDVYVSSFISVNKYGMGYSKALFSFSYTTLKEVLELMSDNAIKELYGIAMVSTMYVSSIIKPELKLQANEIVTQSMIDVWNKTLNEDSPFFELRKAIDERLKNKSNFHSFLKSNYTHIFQLNVEAELLSEMKKRKLFHDKSFKTINGLSGLRMLSENISVLNNYSNYIKINPEDVENTFLILAEIDFRVHIKNITELINKDSPVSSINSEIIRIGTVLSSIWETSKKYKNNELLEWLNESMQVTFNVIDELGNKNVVINKKPLNLVNNAIYKASLKSTFVKDYFFVKKINEEKERWKNISSFPLEIIDSFMEPELMKKSYGKEYIPKENEANILKVNREDFNSFYLSKGRKAPEAVSSNKMFLSGFITNVRESENILFKQTLQGIKSAQNLDYFYIILCNHDNLLKEDFDAFSQIVFKELVDCNKVKQPSLEKIDSQYETYVMSKDITANRVLKNNIRKF